MKIWSLLYYKNRNAVWIKVVSSHVETAVCRAKQLAREHLENVAIYDEGANDPRFLVGCLGGVVDLHLVGGIK